MDQTDHNYGLVELLKIYRSAMSNEFSPYNHDNHSLLPQEVLKTLTEIFVGAEGGNFSIYRADCDFLDVRGRYSNVTKKAIDFVEFKKRMRAISSNSKRIQSSSYRCKDSNQPVCIPVSDRASSDNYTLDLTDLELKEGLSAAAIPLKNHGRTIGVLHMDSRTVNLQFREHHIEFLQNVSELLSPILHHNLLMEMIGNISAMGLESNDGNFDFKRLCKEIVQILFTPWVGLWMRDDAEEDILWLRGYTGQMFSSQDIEKMRRISISATGTILTDIFCKFATFTSTEASISIVYQPDQSQHFIHPQISCIGSGIICPLVNESGKVAGAMVFVDGKQESYAKPYLRLCDVVANYVALTIGATRKFAARARVVYETAAHEFGRNLRNLDNTQLRLSNQIKNLESLYKQEKPINDDLMYHLRTLDAAFYAHIDTAKKTQFSLTGKKSAESSDQHTNIWLEEAKKRQERTQNETISFDIRDEINNITNGFTRAMSKKRVEWRPSGLETLPRLISNVHRENFSTVFGNLVDNAVKYAKQGTNIDLRAEVTEFHIYLTLVNIGPFIDINSDEAGDIYLPRVRGRYATISQGDGLGLWQAKAIAKLWGGDIQLMGSHRNNLGENDDVVWGKITFRITIPIDQNIYFTHRRGSHS